MKILAIIIICWIIAIGGILSQKEESNLIATEVRLIWGDEKYNGGGEWREATEKNVHTLKAWVDHGNNECPWLNHRLEYR